MRHGKHAAPISRKAKITTVALVVLLCCAVGGTLAWLAASTKPVTNTFTPAQVECVVDDDYINNEKTNIVVTNPEDAEGKNVDAYIRVTLVPTWEEKGDTGNAVAVAKKVEGLDYPTELGTGWIQIGEYYYYNKIVKVGDSTPALFDSAIKVPTDSIYALNLQVLAEAIQADGMDGEKHVVETVWPAVTVGADGTLSAAAAN